MGKYPLAYLIIPPLKIPSWRLKLPNMTRRRRMRRRRVEGRMMWMC